jgi:pantoate--beta-alanine ligase
MKGPVVLETIAALRDWRADQRAAGRRVGLVPTMGALHQGHLSLVDGVRKRTEATVVSIFVNPTQFAPSEDFNKYPRQFEADLKLLSQVKADAVFAPGVSEMYPNGFATTIEPLGPAKVGLEDAFRPTHFAGVATVVTKLLLQGLPDAAIFGEKDFQQLAVIRHVARDLDIPVEILGGATIREPDGLAMSSRNAYLTPEHRMIATMIHQTLQGAKDALARGKPAAEIEPCATSRLVNTGFRVDYVAIRDAATLAIPAPGADPASLRILVAASIGATRLIDNIAGG